MRVAVLTAYNPHNAGMYSVDLAAQRFLGEAGHDYRLYRVLHGRKGPYFMNGGRLRRMRDLSPLRRADAILYWGDFLNNPLYAVEDFHIRERYYAKRPHDIGASLATWKRFFLLQDFEPGDRKVVSVSNNFQSANRVVASFDRADREEVGALLGRFDGIFPRDPASTAEVEKLLGPDRRARVATGVDAAVLNRRPGGRAGTGKPTSFTWFFSRSGLSSAEQRRLVAATAERTGLAPVHLSRWLSLNYLTWDWQFRRMTRQMAQASFCLSDTYHCLINAMVQDTPVIGIGRRADAQEGTLGDFKKRELFGMFALRGSYVEIGAGALDEDAVERVVALAGGFARDGAPGELYATLDEKADAYRALLRSTLS